MLSLALALLIPAMADTCAPTGSTCTVGATGAHATVTAAVAAGCTDIQLNGTVSDNVVLNGVGDVRITGAGVSSSILASATTGTSVIEAQDAALCMSDVTVTGGVDAPCGGGIRVGVDATFDLDGVLVRHNSAQDGGGLCLEGTGGLVNSAVQRNDAAGRGGGVFLAVDHDEFLLGEEFPVIGGSVIRRNTAADGGGLAAVRGSLLSYFVMQSVEVYLNAASNDGGGLWLDDVRMATTDMVLQTNNAVGSGGGAHLDDGASWEMGAYGPAWVEVIDNRAGDNGGGLFVGPGSLVSNAVDSYFEVFDNLARRGDGGGVALVGGTLDNQDSTQQQFALPGGIWAIDNNVALLGKGGGLYAVEGTVDMQGVYGFGLQENEAAQSGGGAFLRDSTATLTALVYGNRSGDAGGGFMVTGSTTLTASQLHVLENTATGLGGGLRIAGSAVMTGTNVAVHDNVAADGGGIHTTATCSLDFSTIAQNIGVVGVPGHQVNGDIALETSAVGDSLPGEVGCVGLSSITKSNSEDASCFVAGGGNVLGALLMEPGVPSPQSMSPLVDAETSGPAEDLLGTSRPLGSGYDRGAFEAF